jgi:trehalose/maltose transport system substrate-binding protein
MPGGLGTLGGSGLSVSQHSDHRKETIEFVRFLVRAQIQSNENRKSAPPDGFEIYNLPSALDLHGDSQKPIQRQIRLVNRPSVEAGGRYKEVSAAYAAAVHSVLTEQKRAPDAAAELEKLFARGTAPSMLVLLAVLGVRLVMLGRAHGL